MEDRMWNLQQEVNTLDKKMLLVARKIDDLDAKLLAVPDDTLQISVRELTHTGFSVENRLSSLTKRMGWTGYLSSCY